MNEVYLWIGFTIFVFAMLALDLGVFQHKAHVIKVKEALLLTSFWILLAVLFGVGVYFWRGGDVALRFFTGYVLEYSLSVDNLFVFLLIFTYFQVPAHHQHKILFWGIIGAQIMRTFFILTGVTLIHKFHWVIYVFGAFLVFTGFKLAFEKDKDVEPEKNPLLKLFRRVMPVTEGYEHDKFFVKRAGRLFATPMFIVLLVVETTDVVFAVDSIPAILAITTDAFIVYTSNMFAILGLRSLYFALAGMMALFCYLNYGLAMILIFVGVKMLVSEYIKIPIALALGLIASILFVSIVASIMFPEAKKETESS